MHDQQLLSSNWKVFCTLECFLTLSLTMLSRPGDIHVLEKFSMVFICFSQYLQTMHLKSYLFLLTNVS